MRTCCDYHRLHDAAWSAVERRSPCGECGTVPIGITLDGPLERSQHWRYVECGHIAA